MKHVIFFMHVFKFSVLILPLLIMGIHKKTKDNYLKKFFKETQIFFWAIFICALIEMIVYYVYFVANVNSVVISLLYTINPFLWLVCFALWLKIQKNVLGINKKEFLDTILLRKSDDSEDIVENSCAVVITALFGVTCILDNLVKAEEFELLYAICALLVTIILILLVAYTISKMHILVKEKVDINFAFEKAKEDYNLTEREVAVLKELFCGKNNIQISESLYISGSTVKSHIHNLLNKMNSDSRAEAVYKVFKGYFNEELE